MNIRKLYLLSTIICMLILLFVLGNVIATGEKLSYIHPSLAYLLYFLLLVLLNIGILHPIYKVLRATPLDLSLLYQENHPVNTKEIQQLAQKFIEESDLNHTQKENLATTLTFKNTEATFQQLKTYTDERFSQMDTAIIEKAQWVFIATAISQNGRIDAITSLMFNIQLVNQLIRTLGFRPSYKQLTRLYLNIFLTAFIAESLDDLFDAENGLLTGALSPFLKGIPFIQGFASSAMNGTFNAFLTLRIGYITKAYLKGEEAYFSKKCIRKNARLFARKSIKAVIKQAVSTIKRQKGVKTSI